MKTHEIVGMKTQNDSNLFLWKFETIADFWKQRVKESHMKYKICSRKRKNSSIYMCRSSKYNGVKIFKSVFFVICNWEDYGYSSKVQIAINRLKFNFISFIGPKFKRINSMIQIHIKNKVPKVAKIQYMVIYGLAISHVKKSKHTTMRLAMKELSIPFIKCALKQLPYQWIKNCHFPP